MAEKKSCTLILTYEFPPAIGGIGYYTYGVAKALNSISDSVVVVAPCADGYGDFDRSQDFKIIRVSETIVVRELMMLIYMVVVLISNPVKRIFNSVWLPCGVITFFITRFIKIPYFIAAHGSDILDDQNVENKFKHFLRQSLSWLKDKVLKNATSVFAVSSFTRDILLQQNTPEEKINVILNGVDNEKFRPMGKPVDLVGKHDIYDKKIILTVARLDRYKGQDMIIKALPEVLKIHPDIVYLIVGKGPQNNELKKLVRDSGLDSSVRFAGFVPDEKLPEYYNLCDVFIMVPRQVRGDYEGFGLTYLEANACGKPVIGSRTGGVPEAIIEGKTGFIVDPDSVEEISSALITMLSEKQLADNIGNTGKIRIEKELSWDLVAGRMWSIMQS